ncbi:DUF4255 domain-containing protein [Novosphingobium sp. 9U]|uniref:DUF4255 domain-containing protein n=1 Tax=Novosphingobium sp. 9U TaxID=2653158 RepID=UPI0012EEE499|nr:DUF4255 domain-containing protein [Novosphingobium sp. 9U]VWX50909.1 conserved hypothetical protein [Novosphingobium sp. 9U]
MSNHLAIATVTAALGNIVHAAAKSAVPGTGLRFGRPIAAATNQPRQANVYLYNASLFGAMRNEDLPQRNAGGVLTRRPSAPVSLSYLFSFYGDDAAFEPDRMLGAVMRDLHATPLLLAGDIADAVAGHAALAGSDLATGPARVKFSPIALSLDDVSRLWSVMVQTPYVLSSAWLAEVVQIDALEEAQPAAPVLKRGADDRGPQAVASLPPQIDALWFGLAGTEDRLPALPSLASLATGQVARIAGRRFAADALRVEIAGKAGSGATYLLSSDADGTATLHMPDDAAAAAALAAGPAGLRLVATRGTGEQSSDVMPFLLAPRITALSPDPLPAAGTNTLTVTCTPQVRPGQIASLRLGGLEIAADAHAAQTDTLTFAVPGPQASNGAIAYLTVDGVTSQPVVFDVATGSFAFDDAQRVHVA